jgi:hypothetical protein
MERRYIVFLTEEERFPEVHLLVQYWATVREIRSGPNWTREDLLQVLLFSPAIITPPLLHIHPWQLPGLGDNPNQAAPYQHILSLETVNSISKQALRWFLNKGF